MQRIFPRFSAIPSFSIPPYTVRKSRVRPSTQLDSMRSTFPRRVCRLRNSHHQPHYRSRHSPHSFDLFRQGHATPNDVEGNGRIDRRSTAVLLPECRRTTGGLPPGKCRRRIAMDNATRDGHTRNSNPPGRRSESSRPFPAASTAGKKISTASKAPPHPALAVATILGKRHQSRP